MPSRDYQIVFRGRVAPGTEPETARVNLAKLFKTQPAQVEKLFDGRRQVLKKGLEREAADRYRTALRKAGLIVSVVSAETERSAQATVATAPAADENADLSASQGASSSGKASFAIDDPTAPASSGKAVFAIDDSSPPAAPAPAESEPETAVQSQVAPGTGSSQHANQDVIEDANEEAGLAPVGVQLVAPEVVAPLTFDLADIELAEPDELVDDTPPPPPLEVDTSGLSASDDFTALDEQAPPPAPEVDVSGLAVATDESPVDAAEPPAPADIDTSGLSVTEGFDSLDPDRPAARPAIDTSHLELVPGPEGDS